jgi:hypothetical protein
LPCFTLEENGTFNQKVALGFSSGVAQIRYHAITALFYFRQGNIPDVFWSHPN